MNVLLLGNGGREHALAWRISQSPLLKRLFVAPGNAGTRLVAENLAIDPMDFASVDAAARQNRIDLVVVGPEDPLAGGIVDFLREKGFRVFGPSQQAAQMEGDKWFAKEMMRRQRVPTGDARLFTDPESALRYLEGMDGPCVVKASGLAKGKGVTVCHRKEDAVDAINRMMSEKVFGAAGARVVIEEFLTGQEASVLAFVSRRDIYLMETAQDHKAVMDGDTGPMTGGMGAYTPTPVVNSNHLSIIEREVFVPIIDGLRRDGIDYEGVLYAGLMMTAGGPKVLEFNCRFGDPETEPLMMRLKSDLLEVLLAVADHRLGEVSLKWDSRPSVCVVACSGGYPGTYAKGKPISGLEAAEACEGVRVFHCGTRLEKNQVVTDGGRVLAVTSIGDTVATARQAAYDALGKIQFEGMHYRRDIGHWALRAQK